MNELCLAKRRRERRTVRDLIAITIWAGGMLSPVVVVADAPRWATLPDATAQPESQPVPESRPAPPETQPSETQPSETQPVETQPVETQPVESQPVESQPSTRPQRRGRPERGGRRGAATQSASGPSTTSSAATTGTGTSTTSSQPAEPKDRYLAIINGQVHTVTGPVLENATVLCKNGRIVQMGQAIQTPAECEIIDATGKRVYPGLVAAGAGGLHGNAPVEDTTDVFSLFMNIASAAGITTASAGNTVAKVTYGSVEEMIVLNPAFVELNYRSNRPLERAQLRADLERVRKYLRDLAAYEIEKKANPEAKEPDKAWLRDKYESYRKLLRRETRAVVSASESQSLLDLADLAEEFGFDLTIRGAVEGWVVAPQLARARVGVIITARTNIPPDENRQRDSGSTIENARILFEHGIPVAVTSPTSSVLTWGVGGRDLTNLNMEAAFCVRGGMKNEDALRTITIDAARVLGVEERVGSIEVGKDADLIVCDGDLLHYMTMVHYTVVNGRLAYEKSKESLFSHIRPDGKREVAQFDDQWPRRLEWREEQAGVETSTSTGKH